MSTDNKEDKELERFLNHQIYVIGDFFEGEEEFDKKLREKYYTPYTFQINILNKEWVKKWKGIVGYEQIKEKCRRCNNSRQNEKLKDELYEFFIKNDTKKKLEELGKMSFPNIKTNSNIENANNILFNEAVNFIPMLSYHCSYLPKYIEDIILVAGTFVKGKCFLYNEIKNKNKIKEDKIKEKKVLILEKKAGNNNDEFNVIMITLDEKEDIKKFINNVKNKTFEDLMKDKILKVEKRDISQNHVKEIIKDKNDIKENKGEIDKNKKVKDKENKGETDIIKKVKENNEKKVEDKNKKEKEEKVFNKNNDKDSNTNNKNEIIKKNMMN